MVLHFVYTVPLGLSVHVHVHVPVHVCTRHVYMYCTCTCMGILEFHHCLCEQLKCMYNNVQYVSVNGMSLEVFGQN